jgi:O-antigen/teichoic acid export membrane protein
MSREVARCTAIGDPDEARHLLGSLEVVYWVAAVVIGLAVLGAANWLGLHWLQSKDLAPQSVIHAVMIMGLVILVRWPVGLYASALMGAQRMATVSAISILVVTTGSVACVLLLAFLSPTINTFLLCQLGIGCIHVAVLRTAVWLALGGRHRAQFRIADILRIWRFSAGLGAVAVSGIVIMQADKIVLRKIAPLDVYGRYALATLLASGIYLMVTPVFNVLYPRFTALVAVNETDRLLELYRLSSRLLATLLFPVGFALALYAEPLIRLWTHSPDTAALTAPIASLLVAGSTLHGILFMPYALQLAHGSVRLALSINLMLLALYLPVLIALTISRGAFGAALAWFLLHCFFLVVATSITHKYLLRGTALVWLFRDVGIPLGITVGVMACAAWLRPVSSLSGIQGALGAAASALVAVMLSLICSPALRASLIENLRLKKRLR